MIAITPAHSGEAEPVSDTVPALYVDGLVQCSRGPLWWTLLRAHFSEEAEVKRG